MSNRNIAELWGATPNFAGVYGCCEFGDAYPDIKTFFGGFNNPVGIEVEVEGVTKTAGKLQFWTHTEDHSLRNNGREFISVPLSGRQIDFALVELAVLFKGYGELLSWSHRTSIHVHQNFSTMREEQLMAYVMVYGLYEELFYAMVAPYRAANPYCYKATSVEPENYVNILDTNKYCGLNLAPLKRQCTVEFRQMHGTADFKLLRRWIQLIVKLHAWVEKQPSRRVVALIKKHIEEETFIPLAKEIWGVNSTLFDPLFIQAGAKRNSLWSLCVANREFT